ncbi:MAG: hypothetical protein LAO55_16150 [Acidobacteriia bacterium]|nr:hypothetical protein [Terriglobia bacterium]
MELISYLSARGLRAVIGLAVVVGGMSLLCTPASAQISLVHVTNCGSGPFPGTVCTIPATSSGNLIVVGIQKGMAGGAAITVASVTDNAGNVYAEAGAARATVSIGYVGDIWYAKNSVAGATSVTVAFSQSVSQAGAVIWEFSGADQTAPLGQTAVLNDQPASTNVSGAVVTTTSTGELVVSIAAVSDSVTGSTNAFINDSALMTNGWAHLIASAPGLYGAQWNQAVAGTYCTSTVSFRAASASVGNACDLNSDGAVNILDVNRIVSMVLGQTACSANINGAGVCTVVTVQRVVNAALPAGTCVVDGQPPPPPPQPHSVTLSWLASITSNVTYNIYRGTTSGGPYAKVNGSPLGLSYVDNSVQSGQTYYYVATAVDANGIESVFSNQATAVIPSP